MDIGRIIGSPISRADIHYNLALEHAILRQQSRLNGSPTLRYWINPPCVVLGRNQILEDEVDVEYCIKNKIVIARRISGGGAVYQDDGNLNVSVFFEKRRVLAGDTSLSKITALLVSKFAKIIEAGCLEATITYSGPSVFWNALKVSGSAGYLRQGWILHHATLLLSADLEKMSKSLLAGDGATYSSSQGRKSSHFPTTNLPKHFSVMGFMNGLEKILGSVMGCQFMKGDLDELEIDHAHGLSTKLYSSEAWIHGGERIAAEDLGSEEF